MKISVLVILALFLTSCVNNQNIQKDSVVEVKRSWYLNRSLMDFEMNNGFCYETKDLGNGESVCYYQSDRVGTIIQDLFDEDSYPYCKVALYTDSKKIIRKIEILEDDIKCARILR